VAVVMHDGREVLNHCQTLEMGERLGLGQRFLTPPYGLCRIA
jgi:hypothetical protein